MRRVLYDVTRLLARHRSATPTGIDRVDVHYAHHFWSRPDTYALSCVHQKEGSFVLLPQADASSLIGTLYDRWIGKPSEPGPAPPLHALVDATLGRGRRALTNVRLERNLSSGGQRLPLDEKLASLLLEHRYEEHFYVNTSHHGIKNRELFLALKTVTNTRFVFFLHDLIPVDFPEYVREGDDRVHAERLAIMAEISDLILVNSRYTEQRFRRYAEDHKLPLPRTQVLEIGVEESFLAATKSAGARTPSPASPYFVTIGTVEPRKNHLLLLQIWRALATELKDDAPQLIIIGARGWNNQNVFDLLDRSPALQCKVSQVAHLSDDRMRELLANARALLFPSFVEGWGMPLVEAMTLGVPAVCSDVPALRESGRELALYLDPLDAAAWRRLIEHLAAPDSSTRRELSARCALFTPPRWHDHFSQLDACLAAMEPSRVGLARRDLALSDDLLRQRFLEYQRSAERRAATTPPAAAARGVEAWFVAALNEQHRKKYRKLKRDPVRFFADSKHPRMRKLGQLLTRRKKG